MNARELYEKYTKQKNNMMITHGQLSTLKLEFSLDDYLNIHNKIQVMQNALNNSYYPKNNINHVSIADYWINRIDEGYNKYTLSGKGKDIKLYNEEGNYTLIRDKIAKEFITLYIQESKLKEWINNDWIQNSA